MKDASKKVEEEVQPTKKEESPAKRTRVGLEKKSSEQWGTYLESYEVSSFGNIRRKRDQFDIRKRLNPAGYVTCTLFYKGKHRPLLVHRIVASVFLGSPPDTTYTVDHVNRVRSDNHVSNLRWFNKTDQRANTSPRKTKASLGVRSIMGEAVVEYQNIDDAVERTRELLGINSKHVTVSTCIVKSIRSGKKYKGYNWEYVSDEPIGSIAGIPSLPKYEVSTCGMIRQLNGRWTKGRVKNGYLLVGITNEHGVPSERRVHRLVAEAFIGGRTQCCNIVNHLNGDKLDNRSVNLEWTNPSGNSKHAVENGLTPIPTGKKIRQLGLKTGVLVRKHDSVHNAAKSVNGSYQNLIACANGRQRTAYGYKWSW